MAIETVGDLIEILTTEYAPDQALRLATQPGHPFEHLVASVGSGPFHTAAGAVIDDAVFIVAGDQVGYLLGETAEALDFR